MTRAQEILQLGGIPPQLWGTMQTQAQRAVNMTGARFSDCLRSEVHAYWQDPSGYPARAERATQVARTLGYVPQVSRCYCLETEHDSLPTYADPDLDLHYHEVPA